MKPIRITADNRPAIKAALDAANGRATSHTCRHAIRVEDAASDAEARLQALPIPKAARAGAEYTWLSGDALPNAYKYTVIRTRLRLARRASGWYLIDVMAVEYYPRGGVGGTLILTPDQDAKAVAALRTGYRLPGGVVKPPPLPITWRCECGDSVLNHYAYCAKCGRDRPITKGT